MIDEEEFHRWLRQAEHNLKSAKSDAEQGDYDWACFKAQQASEIAIKALTISMGKIIKGHSVFDLLKCLGEFGLSVSDELLRCARKLDKFYIPTRYPDAIGLGSPYESFDKEDSDYAIKCSEAIFSFIRQGFENAKNN
jgi:HEPN domain-containing protein